MQVSPASCYFRHNVKNRLHGWKQNTPKVMLSWCHDSISSQFLGIFVDSVSQSNQDKFLTSTNTSSFETHCVLVSRVCVSDTPSSQVNLSSAFPASRSGRSAILFPHDLKHQKRHRSPPCPQVFSRVYT